MRPTATPAVPVLAYTLLAACIPGLGGVRAVPDRPMDPNIAGQPVVVGQGGEGSGWRAWVYRTLDGSICFETAATDQGSSSCGSGLDGILGLGVAGGTSGQFVSGGTVRPDAVAASIDVTGGAPVVAPLAAAPAVLGPARVFVARLPGGAAIGTVHVLNAAGTELETLDRPVDDPAKVPPVPTPVPGTS